MLLELRKSESLSLYINWMSRNGLGVKVLIMSMIKGNFIHCEDMIEKVLFFFFQAFTERDFCLSVL